MKYTCGHCRFLDFYCKFPKYCSILDFFVNFMHLYFINCLIWISLSIYDYLKDYYITSLSLGWINHYFKCFTLSECRSHKIKCTPMGRSANGTLNSSCIVNFDHRRLHRIHIRLENSIFSVFLIFPVLICYQYITIYFFIQLLIALTALCRFVSETLF